MRIKSNKVVAAGDGKPLPFFTQVPEYDHRPVDLDDDYSNFQELARSLALYIYYPRSYDEEFHGVQLDSDQMEFDSDQMEFDSDQMECHQNCCNCGDRYPYNVKAEPDLQSSPWSDVHLPHAALESDRALSPTSECFSDRTHAEQYTPASSADMSSPEAQYTPSVSPYMSPSEEHHVPEFTVPIISSKVRKRKSNSNPGRGRPRRRRGGRSQESAAPAVIAPEIASRSDQPQEKISFENLNYILLGLREKQCLPWKTCAEVLKEQSGQYVKVPALQMRLKRYGDQLRSWACQNNLLKDEKVEAKGGIRTHSRRYEVMWIADAMVGSRIEHI